MIPDSKGNEWFGSSFGKNFTKENDDGVEADDEAEEAQGDGDDEANDLIAGEGRDEHRDGQVGAAHEEGPEIT